MDLVLYLYCIYQNIVEKLQYLFNEVAANKKEPEAALNEFLFMWGGGPVYIPKKPYQKQDIVVAAFKCGMSEIEIHKTYNVQFNYVYNTLKKLRTSKNES